MFFVFNWIRCIKPNLLCRHKSYSLGHIEWNHNLCITGLCEENPPVNGWFPSLKASKTELWCSLILASKSCWSSCRWFETPWHRCNGLVIISTSNEPQTIIYIKNDECLLRCFMSYSVDVSYFLSRNTSVHLKYFNKRLLNLRQQKCA